MEAPPKTYENQARALNNLGESLLKTQPEYSRYCIFRAKTFKMSKDPPLNPHCQLCCTIFTSNNHKVRLAPRTPLTKKLKKLLDRYAQQSTSASASSSLHPTLSKCQLKMVKGYLNSRNVLTVSCNTCGKTTKTKCQGRSDRVKQLLSWREPIEIEEKEESFTKKRKKKSKKASVSPLSVISPDEFIGGTTNGSSRPISIGSAKTNLKNKNVGAPLGTSTPITTPDSRKEDGSLSQVTKSSDLKKKDCQQAPRTNKSSPVLALLESMGVKSGGVAKKKKKGRDKHQQLEKMLKEQKSAKPPTQQKNSLADFLSQMTY
ncbi:UPF0711 protein C18orf21-like isoform X1 [Haliotis cracherodii]|uniref:UPF0711 protein C18orf21-like isoform X1 n=1 Tax=Haliotis cracherodii TaxID=6455 RepID=UPI0039EA029F